MGGRGMQEVTMRRSAATELPRRPALWPLALIAIVAIPVVVAAAGYAGHWNADVMGISALLPLWLVVVPLVVWFNRVYGAAIAFFAVVALPQLGHFGEHLGQMVQIHWQDAPPPKAGGAVGQLNIEWVHFLWNGWAMIGGPLPLTLLRRHPRLSVT